MTTLHKALYRILVVAMGLGLIKIFSKIQRGGIPDFYDLIAMGIGCVVIITVTVVQFWESNKRQP